MKHIVCDLCGADDYEVVAETGRLGLPIRTVICRHCGLVYTNPIHSLGDYRGEEAEKVRRLMRPAERPSEKYLAKNRLRAEGAMELIGPLLGPGLRVLDVGSAAGTLLAMARERGCEVVGVEPEPAFAEYAREQLGLEVHECLLEDAPLAERLFDIACASHVLEHTESPTAFLAGLHKLVAPGGHLFVEVPNILEPRCSLRRVFHVAHRFSFSPQTLQGLLRKVGFEVEQVRELPGPGSVQVLARRAEEGTPMEPQWDGQEARRTLGRLRRHRWMYYLSLMFLRRKLRRGG